jgi:hypothetical protein
MKYALKDIELAVKSSAIDQVEYLHENKHIEDGMISLWAKRLACKGP